MKCATKMWKQIIIMHYAIYIWTWKKTWQGYGVKFYLILMLNKLKKMRGPIYIYIPLGT
jgi:hypothetical protein